MSKLPNVKITNELKNPTEVGLHHRLLCMTGQSKGKVYYLIGKRIIIGRGDSADIQIVDTKISREHAELSFADNGYTITDLGAQNGIVINDTKVKQKKLQDAEKIVIGSTVFKYNLLEVLTNELAVVDTPEIEVTKEPKKKRPKVNSTRSQREDSYSDFGKAAETETKGGSPKVLIFVLILGGVFYALFSGDNGGQTGTNSKRKDSNADLNNDFSAPLIKKVEVEDVEIRKKLDALIHSGRREFSEGNYFRAMEDFRLALLLNPNNGQASYYLSKAKQSLDDDIRKNFEKGKQEYESKSYRAAIVSYCGVVQLIQNYPNDERYKNALLQISAIESEMGIEKGEIKCFETKSAEPKN